MAKADHTRVELLVVAVCAVLAGANTCVEIEGWGKEKLDWLGQSLKAELRHFVMNLIRLAAIKRKGGIQVRRLIAATSDAAYSGQTDQSFRGQSDQPIRAK